MEIKVKIYSCYQRTYMPICKRILKLLYGEDINLDDVKIEIEFTRKL